MVDLQRQLRERFAALFGARDPARRRLTTAVAVTAGVVASGLASAAIVHALHADAALLVMGIFFSIQAGNLVKDTGAGSRVVTTALLCPAVVLAIALASVLEPYRPASIAVFVLLTGAAVWIRGFGPRAAAIGGLAFMGYFFTLFMRPEASELPAVLLVAASAVAAQAATRSVLLLKRPRRELVVLLRELRAGSNAALHASRRPGQGAGLRSALARLDDVGAAITSWQQSFHTDRQIACDAPTLDALVLDARIDTAEACYAAARPPSSPGDAERMQAACSHLADILAEHATVARIDAATAWAERERDRASRGPDGTGAYLVSRAVLAHARVRRLDLSHGLRDAPHDLATRPADDARPRPRHPASPARRFAPWDRWAPTTRMAVQAMIAASLASIVGEAISASRWYWAVMSAFIIFIGATTRGGILTRAFRRVTGTALGIVIGIGAVALTSGDIDALVTVCVAGVFGMLYLGPLNYVYSSTFMTVTLVAMYRMLGVLEGDILELRLVETVCGVTIGVLCAYLVVSDSSRPTLMAAVDAYFAELDALLQSAGAMFADPHAAGDDVFARLHALESAQSDIDQSLSATATAFLARRRSEAEAVHLMYIASRSAARLALSAAARRDLVWAEGSEAADQRVVRAIDLVRRSAERTAGGLRTRSADATSADPSGAVTELLDPSAATSPQGDAIGALVRIDWAMRRLDDAAASPRGRRARPSVAVAPQ